MATRQFTLSEAQAAQLQSAFLHEKDGPTRTRYQAVHLYGTGYRLEDVLEITGCSRTSLFDWCRAYRKGDAGTAGGPHALRDKRAGSNHRKLTPEEIRDLRERLDRYAPSDLFGREAGRHWSVDLLGRALQRWYGVEYRQRVPYQSLFKQCGFSYQRPAKVYRSRSEVDVLDFEQRLEKKAAGPGTGGS